MFIITIMFITAKYILYFNRFVFLFDILAFFIVPFIGLYKTVTEKYTTHNLGTQIN